MAESLTVEQLAENHDIVRWVANTFASQRRWHLCDRTSWRPETIQIWAQEAGAYRISAMYEHCESVTAAEFEALLDLSMEVGDG